MTKWAACLIFTFSFFIFFCSFLQRLLRKVVPGSKPDERWKALAISWWAGL